MRGLIGVSVDQVSISTATGTALSLNNVGGALTFSSVSANGAATGITLTSVAAAVAINGGAIQGTTTAGVHIDQGTGAFSYAGAITNSSGRTVEVTNRNSGLPGLVQFTGAIASIGGTGVFLDNNDNGTVTFSGGLTLSTGANAAFTATNGGTVNVCDEDPCATGSAVVNTLTTTTGTALNVANTAIGASGLTFRSISAGTAASGPTNGIVLNDTGASGGLTVTGNSSGICGGSVTNTTTPGTPATVTAADTADCTGGTIQKTTGDGIRLISTAKTSLTRMQIVNNGGSGIFGTEVNGFQLISSYLSNNGTAVGASGDRGLKFRDTANPGSLNGLLGTAINGTHPTRIINSTVRQSAEFNVEIVNRTGTLADLLVDGSQFTDTKLEAGGADGFLAEMQNTATATFHLQNSYFSNNYTQGAQISASDSANVTVTVTSSTFTNNNEGFVCDHSGNSHLTCTVGGDSSSQGNTFQGQPTAAIGSGAYIVASSGSTATASANLTAKFKNNNVQSSANQVNHAVIAFMSGTNTPGSVDISNNTVNHVAFGHAILVDTPDNATSPQFGVTANNNSVTNTAAGGHGVLVQARQNSTGCVLKQNNTGTVADPQPQAGHLVLNHRDDRLAGQQPRRDRLDDGDDAQCRREQRLHDARAMNSENEQQQEGRVYG